MLCFRCIWCGWCGVCPRLLVFVRGRASSHSMRSNDGARPPSRPDSPTVGDVVPRDAASRGLTIAGKRVHPAPGTSPVPGKSRATNPDASATKVQATFRGHQGRRRARRRRKSLAGVGKRRRSVVKPSVQQLELVNKGIAKGQAQWRGRRTRRRVKKLKVRVARSRGAEAIDGDRMRVVQRKREARRKLARRATSGDSKVASKEAEPPSTKRASSSSGEGQDVVHVASDEHKSTGPPNTNAARFVSEGNAQRSSEGKTQDQESKQQAVGNHLNDGRGEVEPDNAGGSAAASKRSKPKPDIAISATTATEKAAPQFHVPLLPETPVGLASPNVQRRLFGAAGQAPATANSKPGQSPLKKRSLKTGGRVEAPSGGKDPGDAPPRGPRPPPGEYAPGRRRVKRHRPGCRHYRGEAKAGGEGEAWDALNLGLRHRHKHKHNHKHKHKHKHKRKGSDGDANGGGAGATPDSRLPTIGRGDSNSVDSNSSDPDASGLTPELKRRMELAEYKALLQAKVTDSRNREIEQLRKQLDKEKASSRVKVSELRTQLITTGLHNGTRHLQRKAATQRRGRGRSRMPRLAGLVGKVARKKGKKLTFGKPKRRMKNSSTVDKRGNMTQKNRLLLIRWVPCWVGCVGIYRNAGAWTWLMCPCGRNGVSGTFLESRSRRPVVIRQKASLPA